MEQKCEYYRTVRNMAGKTIWLTGLSGSGKSTLGNALKEIFDARGFPTVFLDGDALRSGLNRDLGFSALDRAENIRRAGEVAKIFNDLGNITLAAFITPLESIRTAVRSIFDPEEFVEIYLNCPLAVCEARDPKGLYARARKGLIPEFTGISSPFQPPEHAEIIIETDRHDPEESVQIILKFLENRFPELRSTAGKRIKRRARQARVAVIGLDCAPPSIIFDESIDLPNLRSLMRHGVWGPLRSTDPPITVPAWTTITTGRDPGELGIYGFRNRLNRDDYSLITVNSTHVRLPRVWDHLEANGKRCVLIGIPQTFPAEPHSGVTIAGFPAVEDAPDFTFPPDLLDRIPGVRSAGYVSDIRNFRTLPKDSLLSALYGMADARFKVARELLLKDPWDFFMMVEIAPDRLHHAFWGDYDSPGPSGRSGSRWDRAIPDFYRYLDLKIGEILGLLDDETTVIVVSDHGAKRSTGGVCINEWLIKKGLLTLKVAPTEETRLTEEMIDWDKTYVWSEGGYYARIFMNVQGREPRGIIRSADYEAFRDNLRDQLVSMPELNGERATNVVLKPEELYHTVNGVAPDLIVYFEGLNKRSIGNVGMNALVVKGEVAGLDSCNHDYEGIFIGARLHDLRRGLKIDRRVSLASCIDIAPTILAEYGLECPRDIRGNSIGLGAGDAGLVAGVETINSRTVVPDSMHGGRGFTSEEEEIVKQRLTDLGYI
ncbi:MAG: adenylyl-sulfate kinase [Desulfomonilaceae bacterium]